MGRVASGHPTRFDEPEFLTDMIQGLGEICQELNASDGMSGRDYQGMLYSIGLILEDFSYRLEGRLEKAPHGLEAAVARQEGGGVMAQSEAEMFTRRSTAATALA